MRTSVSVRVLHEELADASLLMRIKAVPHKWPVRLAKLPELIGNIGHGDLEHLSSGRHLW